MKKYISVIVCLFLFTCYCNAQKRYTASQTEFIFSSTKQNTTSFSSSSIVRFSGFINHEFQRHTDISKKWGYYVGMGIKNIGCINQFGTYKFKQRAYSLNIPLAIKYGRVSQQFFIAFGGELNFFFNYKEKFLYNETKTRRSEWFSNKVNWFNPAAFFQIKFLKTQVVTFKYYFNDFLAYDAAGLTLPDGTLVKNYGKSSKLFYLSWASHLELKDPNKTINRKAEKRIRTAQLMY